MIAAAQPGAATSPIALFVMGMGRSGTSAITRVLSLCGGALPTALVGANAGNPRGHWEPRAALDLNESILHRHGSSWHDPTLRLQEEEEGAFGTDDRAACIAEVGAFLGTLPAAPLMLIKEPRITALSGIWFEAAQQVGRDIAAVIAVRHPQEVAASLAARDQASLELSSALWLKYSLLAERNTRGLRRVFVEYANFLDDWRLQVSRISSALAIDLDTRDEAAIDKFLEEGLRRQRYCGPVPEPFGTDWISVVYGALCGAARDQPADEAVLDGVYGAYRASEHGFRVALEDYHDHFSGAPARQSIAKLIRSAAAVVYWR